MRYIIREGATRHWLVRACHVAGGVHGNGNGSGNDTCNRKVKCNGKCKCNGIMITVNLLSETR